MEFFVILLVFAIIIIITRLFGAWMLRINEIIVEQKKTNELLSELIKKGNSTSED